MASEASRADVAPISVVDLFTIGVGPSSSHTVGPMRAAKSFATLATGRGEVVQVECHLYGSLALTGRGHATDKAVMLGLSGWRPEDVDPDRVEPLVQEIAATGGLHLAGRAWTPFRDGEHLLFHRTEFLPRHPNGMRFVARFADGAGLEQTVYSVGGGAILVEGEPARGANVALRLPFSSAVELLDQADRHGISIAELVLSNEEAWRDRAETIAFLDRVRLAMLACIDRGLTAEGVLPGGLGVGRRARSMQLELGKPGRSADPSAIFDWVSLYALAVSEENAAGGRVVTAPTNGAAGVIPAVLKYFEAFAPGATLEGSRRLLLTAAAVGMLYKLNASISAAEMGCQGEIGVACSMAAAGLTAALGGDNRQIENAAEIGMEHNLGLTCDPIGGLVQVPCIERNTMGALKAINAARLAMHGDGRHHVSLDAVIETMRETGRAMDSRYKETSLGGLAVNAVAC